MSANAKRNGHADREQLALVVQTEALRPTPPITGPSLQDRLSAAWRRIRELEDRVAALQQQKRENREQFAREIATRLRIQGPS